MKKLRFGGFGEAPEIAERGKSALDDPALGQNDEALGVDSFHHLAGDPPMSWQRRQPVEEFACVASVHKDGLQPAVAQQKRPQKFGPISVLQAGRMHRAAQNQSEGVHQQMPFSSADLLASIEAPLAGLANHLNALAVDDRSGRGFFYPP